MRVEELQNLLTSLQRKCNVFSLTDPADVNELEISYRPTTELSLFLSAGLEEIHAFCCYSENLLDCERFHVFVIGKDNQPRKLSVSKLSGLSRDVPAGPP